MIVRNPADGELDFRVIHFEDDKHFNEVQRVPWFSKWLHIYYHATPQPLHLRKPGKNGVCGFGAQVLIQQCQPGKSAKDYLVMSAGR
ncbi:MAG: hypothetical protein JWR09_1133 [Mucilaginibacter sp.]|nr:hypothetical protein [Mucilaginibacter sp.]